MGVYELTEEVPIIPDATEAGTERSEEKPEEKKKKQSSEIYCSARPQYQAVSA